MTSVGIMQIEWSSMALKSLENIYDYICEKDHELAVKTYASIQKQVSILGTYQQYGRAGRVFGTRELVISDYPYIIPYRVKGDAIEILYVFHTSRKLPDTW